VNARAVPFIPSDLAKMAHRAASCTMWRCGAQLAAVRLGVPVDARALTDGTVTLDELHAGTGAIGDVKGWWLENVWDLIRLLPEMLSCDIAETALQPPIVAALARSMPPSHVTVIGEYPVLVLPRAEGEAGAETRIDPHVVFDASAGPILVQPGSHIRAFTRINGPCYLGRDVSVMGGEVGVCSIGDVCKVRGELSTTVFAGYANKGHDGFVGQGCKDAPQPKLSYVVGFAPWGWVIGTVFFAANMWWLTKVTVPGSIILIIYLGLFWGFAGWIFVGCRLLPRDARFHPIISVLLLSIIWTALEWVRGNWSMFGNTGLPWLNLGSTQSKFLLMCQIADIGGVYAVTFWVAALNFAVFWMITQRRLNIPLVAATAVLLLAIGTYGGIRMSTEPARPGPVVVVIQPNYKQSNSGEKGASQEEIIRFHLETTKAALAECEKRGIKVDLVAWSETMMPAINPEVRRVAQDRAGLQRIFDDITSLALENRIGVIFGGMYANEWNEQGFPTDRRNSAYLIERSGLLSSTRYDKIHLVPFGEFIPYDNIPAVHSLLMKLGPSGYQNYVLTPGGTSAVFDLNEANSSRYFRFATPICFEDLVGPLVADMVRGAEGAKRADFLVNLTNDGWFMASEMPQHLQAAVFRSIENRVPTARCVNTGVSGFIDSVGRVHDTVAANTEGWSVAQLQLDPRVTFYTRHEDLFVEICAAASALLIAVAIFTDKKRHRMVAEPSGTDS
jgi:apolipoprotein N-acyltransferase